MTDDNEMHDLIERDEAGKFLPGHSLDPERASELGKLSQQNRSNEGREKIEQVARRLVMEKGYDDPDDAPESLWALARVAARGRNGTVTALEHWQPKQRPTNKDQTPPKAERLEMSLTPEAQYQLHETYVEMGQRWLARVNAHKAAGLDLAGAIAAINREDREYQEQLRNPKGLVRPK